MQALDVNKVFSTYFIQFQPRFTLTSSYPISTQQDTISRHQRHGRVFPLKTGSLQIQGLVFTLSDMSRSFIFKTFYFIYFYFILSSFIFIVPFVVGALSFF